MSCPVCGEKLVTSKDTAHKRKFLVCPKVDKYSFVTEEISHYRASLVKIGDNQK